MAKETVTETRVNAQGQRETGTELTHEGVTEITAVLRPLLADTSHSTLKPRISTGT
jgi:hypothetical protein